MTTVARDGDARAIVRSATPADLPAVHALEQAVFPQPWPYAAFRRHCSDPGFLVAVPSEDQAASGVEVDATGDDGGAGVDGGDGALDEDGDGDDTTTTDGEDTTTTASRGHEEADEAAGPTILGYVVADVIPYRGGQLGHVKDLAVAPDHRGEGLGGRLFDRGLAAIGAAGADRAKLEVRADNVPALALYRSRGFEPKRRVPEYYGDGADALVLVGAVAQAIPDGTDESH